MPKGEQQQIIIINKVNISSIHIQNLLNSFGGQRDAGATVEQKDSHTLKLRDNAEIPVDPDNPTKHEESKQTPHSKLPAGIWTFLLLGESANPYTIVFLDTKSIFIFCVFDCIVWIPLHSSGLEFVLSLTQSQSFHWNAENRLCRKMTPMCLQYKQNFTFKYGPNHFVKLEKGQSRWLGVLVWAVLIFRTKKLY